MTWIKILESAPCSKWGMVVKSLYYHWNVTLTSNITVVLVHQSLLNLQKDSDGKIKFTYYIGST